MLRTLVLAVAFLGITLALIMLQPIQDLPGMGENSAVTRADATLDGPELAQVALQQPATSAALPARRNSSDPDLQTMTRGVLVELGVAPASLDTVQGASGDAMRSMSLKALSNLRTITGQPVPEATPLQTLIVQALRAGQSDTYIDTLLNEAAKSGEIRVPTALITSDGRVDTHVLLGSIVAQATIASGQSGAPLAAPSGPGVEVRSVQRADSTTQHHFYTVGPGDSLGAIAVKFFGDVTRYSTIFEANRALLSSPDKLRVGQRLVIPTI